MFNGIWLVASEPLVVHGRAYQPGDLFEISRTESGAFLVLRQATVASPKRLLEQQQPAPLPEPEPDPIPEPDPEPDADLAAMPRRRGRPRKIQTDTVRIEIPAESQSGYPATNLTEATRRYQRRDLEAEE